MKIRKPPQFVKTMDRDINQFLHRREDGISIAEITKGKTIRTGGGRIGLITGKQTKNAVQIMILEGELKGEYDWISKDALVKECKDACSVSQEE